MSAVDVKKLSMPIGEAMFTQRSVRRLKPDPVPIDLIHLILCTGGHGSEVRVVDVDIMTRHRAPQLRTEDPQPSFG